MSLLITGMEMPKSCYKCLIKRREGMNIVCPVVHERFSVADVNILDYRLDNCPLIELPPHGDLIDRDETMNAILEERGEDTACWFAEIVNEMPAIIEAEEDE